MDTAALLRQRLRSQRLAGIRPATPEAVVGWMAAVQAQDVPGATWSLGLRGRGFDVAAVRAALADGRILRTHVLRPTWHFVLPGDIRWMLALTGPRVAQRMAPYYARLELDRALIRRTWRVFTRALRGGQHLTRAELAAALEGAGITAHGQRLAHIVIEAELVGLICSGAPRKHEITYALLEERVPAAPTPTAEESLANLATRFFASHGPATLRDFGWWSGLAMRDVRAAIALVGAGLEQAVVDGTTCYLAPGPRRARAAASSAHLLPTWDEYVVAYQDRGFAVPSPVTMAFGPFSNFVAIGGQVAGTWKRTIGSDGIRIQATLAPGARDARELVAAAAAEYGRFAGLPVQVRWS